MYIFMTIRQMITHASPIFCFVALEYYCIIYVRVSLSLIFSSKNNFNLLNNEKYHTLFTYIVVF